jgi:hypothetical protein
MKKDQKEDIAEAIACPLRVQPGVYNHCRLFLQIGQSLGCCSDKAMLSTQLYSQQRQCSRSRIGGGRLLKAAQERSLASPWGHWPLHHLNNCKALWRRQTQEPSVLCISSCICRSPLLLAIMTGGFSPPPHRAWRGGATTRDGCRPRVIYICMLPKPGNILRMIQSILKIMYLCIFGRIK